MQNKRIPLGISDFKTIIDGDYLYVDKSFFIKEIINNGSQIILLPRPRRFGKTLNLSMLKYFYSNSSPEYPSLFNNLAIIHAENEVTAKTGKYPVIFLTFKDAKCSNFADCLEKMKLLLSELAGEHRYLLDSPQIYPEEKEALHNILWQRVTQANMENFLKLLINLLARHWKQKAVVLIDEYDLPIQAGYMHGYYDEAIGFMRGLLSAALKDNIHLEKCVMTGILRVAKESIFSGLNNLDVSSLLSNECSSAFGFTEEEVSLLLIQKGLSKNIKAVQQWYNGYVFGGVTIFNPWSILSYVKKENDGLRPYWVNTSDNALVRQVVSRGSDGFKMELEVLLKGGILVKKINEDIAYPDIEKSSDSVFSFLLFSGYLKAVSFKIQNKFTVAHLQIPNLEVEYLFEQFIMNWFTESIEQNNYDLMLKSLLDGDIDIFGRVFRDFVLNSFSFFDTQGKDSEKVYHAFVLGLLISLNDTHEVKSNRESGYGRYDVMLIPRQPEKTGVIFEFKKVDVDCGETLETACEMALEQIINKNYKQELVDRGIKNILSLAISFNGKKVLVREGR